MVPLAGDMTWDAVRDRFAAGAPAILPVGAGSKQHGLHLPLDCDAIQASHFARRAAETSGGIVWPNLAYGHYPAFCAYPGSISLAADTFTSMVTEILNGLLSHGARGVLVIDTGISTIAPVARAIAACATRARVAHLAIYRGTEFQRASAACAPLAHDSHAGEIETSIMLALAPDRVDMTRALASPPPTLDAAGRALSPSDPDAPAYSPGGSWGDPTRATRDKGFALLAAIQRDIDAACARICASAP